MKELRPAEVVAYVQDLAAREAHAVGFVPNTQYFKAWDRGHLKLVYENDEPCGFIFHGPTLPACRIYQTAVEPTCRLVDHGREAWLAAMCEALHGDADEIRWICAEDLPANRFWERVATAPMQLLEPPSPHRRRRFEYRYLLPRGKALERYLDDQLRHSTAWKIAKLHGIEHWLELQWSKRWRKNPK